MAKTNVLSLAARDATIFAGTNGNGIFRSLDGGVTWTPVNTGLTTLTVRAIAFAGDAALFAGTQGGGVFLSTDYGDSWTPINTGLISTTVRSLAVEGRNLFAGTDGGVWRYAF
jgi:photosystem II stability/assembly factor-like uncharacterized protein